MNSENSQEKPTEVIKRKRLNSKVEEFIPNIPLTTSEEEPEIKRERKQSTAEVIVDIVSSMKDLYTFTHEFPRLDKYSNLEKIRITFPCLKNINEEFKDISGYEDAHFFIMRSTMPDDIHKAMKYGVWTSTPDHNEILSKAFKDCNQSSDGETNSKGPRKIVLFFRILSENKLLGVAELASDYIADIENEFWWDKIKWKGVFKLNWLFVNDINLNSLEQKEHGKFLYELTDCSKLSPRNGFFLLEFFKIVNFDIDQSLFKHFLLFDQREDYLLNSRSKTDFVISLKKVDKNTKAKKIPFPNHEDKTRKPSFHMTGYIDPELKQQLHQKQPFQNNKKYSKDCINPPHKKEEELEYVKKVEKQNETVKEDALFNKRKNSGKVNNRKNSYQAKQEEIEYVKKL